MLGVDVGSRGRSSRLGLPLDLVADLLDDRRVELDRARQRHLEPLLRLRPELVEAAPDPEDRRHPVLLGEQLEEVDELVGSAPETARAIASRFSAEEK